MKFGKIQLGDYSASIQNKITLKKFSGEIVYRETPLDKIEVGKLYKWDKSIYFITRVDIWSDMLYYYELNTPEIVNKAPYDACRRILEEV